LTRNPLHSVEIVELLFASEHACISIFKEGSEHVYIFKEKIFEVILCKN
jgi:hypothetical protein